MEFFREIKRIESKNFTLSLGIQNDPFEYETLTPGNPLRLTAYFTLPAGLFSVCINSIKELLLIWVINPVQGSMIGVELSLSNLSYQISELD